MYRLPSATKETSLELKDQIRRISNSKPSHLLITGDFNLPDIDWELQFSPSSLNILGTIFMECYWDCFLCQHVMVPTHHWQGCTPTTLNMVFNEEGMVTDTSHFAPLGADYYNIMKFLDPKNWKVSWNRYKSQRRTSWRQSTSWRPIRVHALTVYSCDCSRS